mmetsp:Transcript_40454/g.114401  ORF Transcript_40454/g.114401 Transcript_40454/m.114401 type:complete len:276 (-) Transcript_40454:48-875(-)
MGGGRNVHRNRGDSTPQQLGCLVEGLLRNSLNSFPIIGRVDEEHARDNLAIFDNADIPSHDPQRLQLDLRPAALFALGVHTASRLPRPPQLHTEPRQAGLPRHGQPQPPRPGWAHVHDQVALGLVAVPPHGLLRDDRRRRDERPIGPGSLHLSEDGMDLRQPEAVEVPPAARPALLHHGLRRGRHRLRLNGGRRRHHLRLPLLGFHEAVMQELGLVNARALRGLPRQQGVIDVEGPALPRRVPGERPAQEHRQHYPKRCRCPAAAARHGPDLRRT